jgi:error-prone DNA polymerase
MTGREVAKRPESALTESDVLEVFIFLSIEDETGISNAIIDPELYEQNRSLVTYARFLLVEGTLQNVDKVIHIRAMHIEELNVTAAPTQSHDFH